MKLTLLILLTALISGCTMSGMPGHVGTTTSQLDGERQVHIDPGWIKGKGLDTPLKLGGFWTDKSPDVFHLDVVYMGTESVQGLKVGIDGEITELKPTSSMTDHDYIPGLYNSVASIPGHSESSRRFTVPLEFIRRMTAGQRVILQVDLGSKFTEGTFSFNQTNFAKPAFVKMLTQLQGPR